MLLLDNPLLRYDWGSPAQIPALLGVEPDGGPVAEMWLGAHPAAPSSERGGRPLPDILEAESHRYLGARQARRFGTRLPYLMKVLAAARPLSVQVHPTAAQAAAGFAAEEELGRSRADPRRAFRDAHHKPEILLALSPFLALVGFQDPRQTVAMLDELESPPAARLRAALASGVSTEPDEAALRRVTLAVLDRGGAASAAELAALGAECARRAGASERWGPAWSAAARAAAAFPGDPGVLVTLLLNPVVLEPGSAVFVPAGTVHAYVGGLGVEVMAASDNVVRAGLTTKPVDVALLARLATWRPARPVPLDGDRLAPGLYGYEAPVEEFRLFRVEATGGEAIAVPGGGPRIALAVAGEARLRCGDDELPLGRGQSALVADDDGALQVAGDGTLVVAGVPD